MGLNGNIQLDVKLQTLHHEIPVTVLEIGISLIRFYSEIPIPQNVRIFVSCQEMNQATKVEKTFAIVAEEQERIGNLYCVKARIISLTDSQISFITSFLEDPSFPD